MNIMQKETEDTNNEVSIHKNTTCEIKHSLGGINSRFDTGKKNQ